MISVPCEHIVVGIVQDFQTKAKALFSASHLVPLNKATLRRNHRRTDFFWLPGCGGSRMRLNHWAMDAVYLDRAEIAQRNGWRLGDEIRGPIIIKHSEVLMPCVNISRCSQDEGSRLEYASEMLRGFWRIVECPLTRERQLFAADHRDAVKGKMIFGMSG